MHIYTYLFWNKILLIPEGKDARCDSVEHGRHSITMVTSLWGSGEAGPLCCVLPVGFISSEKEAELTKRFAPDVYFLSSGRPTHFMNAECVVQYFEKVLADAFERRRTRLAERYQRSFQDEWGILLCDSFTGHHSTSDGFDTQRNLPPQLQKHVFHFFAVHYIIYIYKKNMYINIHVNSATFPSAYVKNGFPRLW